VPHDRSVLIDQLRALLTHQRYSSVVIHNYCRNAEHFLEYLAQRDIAAEAATPAQVSGWLQRVPGMARCAARSCQSVHPRADVGGAELPVLVHRPPVMTSRN
jgi:hypothetical protein